MTKPWEETWAPGNGVLHTGTTRIAVFEPVDRAEVSVEQKARARLAAQAPAMARLLMALEWGGSGFRDEGNVRRYWRACPTCFAHRGTPHTADCVLVAVLRAAGVIE